MKKPLFVLVACEESQISCIAFRRLGCVAFSCDIQECSGKHPEWHILSDVTSLLNGDCHFITQYGTYHHVKKWDLILAHPPCTYLSSVTAPLLFVDHHLNRERYEKLKEAAAFFMKIYNCNCEHLCVENPRPLKIAHLPRPDCVVNPCNFGSKYSKRTYLWLRGLPPIINTCVNPCPKSFVYTRSGGKARSVSDYNMYNEIAKQFVNFIEYERRS